MINIERKRYIITRNNRTEIFCGLARDYHFKPIEDIGNTIIKTYQSEKSAINSFKKSWYPINFEFEAIEVIENIFDKEKKNNE